MSSIAANRLKRELQELNRDSNKCTDASDHCPPKPAADNFSVRLLDSSMFHLEAEIAGPPDTPYANGRYRLDIRIPDRYPFVPPSVRFVTRIWHPNISSQTGVICLDILKDKWAAAMTIRSVLLSIQILLEDAQANNPQDAVVAGQFKRNLKLFNQTAAFWNAAFARRSNNDGPILPENRPKDQFPEFECKISQLKQQTTQPTIPDEKLIVALSLNDWDVKKTLNAM